MDFFLWIPEVFFLIAPSWYFRLYIQPRWRLVGFLFGFTPNNIFLLGKNNQLVDTPTGMRFFVMPFDL